MLNLAGPQIAILHKATRGKLLKWNEESIEAIQVITLLSTNNLLYSFLADYNQKFYMSCDTSLCHTFYVLFQLCNKGHPRVIGFYLKTWPESFQVFVAAYRELLGLLTAIKTVQAEVEFGVEPLLVYTDSLTLLLCSQGSLFNSKMARIKIFLSSLPWVEFSWSRGDSKLIKLPDYFSRTEIDVKQYKNKI